VIGRFVCRFDVISLRVGSFTVIGRVASGALL